MGETEPTTVYGNTVAAELEHLLRDRALVVDPNAAAAMSRNRQMAEDAEPFHSIETVNPNAARIAMGNRFQFREQNRLAFMAAERRLAERAKELNQWRARCL